MLRKEIISRLRKILGYATDGWIASYRNGDKNMQFLYDQLYKQVNNVFEFAKKIECYEDSKK